MLIAYLLCRCAIAIAAIGGAIYATLQTSSAWGMLPLIIAYYAIPRGVVRSMGRPE